MAVILHSIAVYCLTEGHSISFATVQELGFLCYAAAEVALKAQGFPSLPHSTDGSGTSVRVGGGGTLVLEECLQAATVYGGVWAGKLQQPGAQSVRVVVKLGPSPDAVGCARQLSLPSWPWEQVRFTSLPAIVTYCL